MAPSPEVTLKAVELMGALLFTQAAGPPTSVGRAGRVRLQRSRPLVLIQRGAQADVASRVLADEELDWLSHLLCCRPALELRQTDKGLHVLR